MKRTRNLFLVKGTDEALEKVFQEVKFKGLTSLGRKQVSIADIVEVFNNNKSVLCTNIPFAFQLDFIEITVVQIPELLSEDIVDFIIINQGNVAEQFLKIADKYDCDIGDHVSNSSGLNGAPSIQDCAYCNYLYKKSYEFNQPEIMVYKSDNFFVFPTRGQFITGYLLIIPFKHVMSIAELDSSIIEEFNDVLDDIMTILKLTYPTRKNGILIWENGTGNSGRGKAKDSIVHAHVHIVPSSLTAHKVQERSGFPFKKISIQGLSDYGNHSYLLIKSDSETLWKIVSDPGLYIPRQYIRQLVAEEYGIPGDQWNWREYPFDLVRYLTAQDIHNALCMHWDELSARIKHNTQILFSNFYKA